jgi:hypothetical protein
MRVPFAPRRITADGNAKRRNVRVDARVRRREFNGVVSLNNQRGKENCPMKAHTVQKITTMSEFIHSEGMESNSKELQIEIPP